VNYAQIKAEIRSAADLLDAGDVAGADAKIRALLGRGLTRADLDANLTAKQLATLRQHARSSERAAKRRERAANRRHGGQ